MHSSSRRLAALALSLAAGACGNDTTPGGGGDDDGGGGGSGEPCDSSYLDYQTFGEPFVLNWCRGCHSSAVPDGMRQNAPANVNFDDAAQVQQWKDRILARATGASPTMPPAGGPPDEERALMAEWIGCGMK